MTVCADCGAEIERVPEAAKYGGPEWAELHHDEEADRAFFTFTCRAEDDWSDPDNPRLLAADYHYVEGEEQLRWRLND